MYFFLYIRITSITTNAKLIFDINIHTAIWTGYRCDYYAVHEFSCYMCLKCICLMGEGMNYFDMPTLTGRPLSDVDCIYGVAMELLSDRFAFRTRLFCRGVIGNPMMTSSNGNIFRVTGHLCGEFTGSRWIPRTKASDPELWCFLWSTPV